MAHIVIVGAGIGGMPAAYEIRELIGKDHRVTVVNSTDYFQFVPSNRGSQWLARTRANYAAHCALSGKKGVISLRNPSRRPTQVQTQLTLGGDQTLDYDYLVITTGQAFIQ